MGAATSAIRNSLLGCHVLISSEANQFRELQNPERGTPVAQAPSTSRVAPVPLHNPQQRRATRQPESSLYTLHGFSLSIDSCPHSTCLNTVARPLM